MKKIMLFIILIFSLSLVDLFAKELLICQVPRADRIKQINTLDLNGTYIGYKSNLACEDGKKGIETTLPELYKKGWSVSFTVTASSYYRREKYNFTFPVLYLVK